MLGSNKFISGIVAPKQRLEAAWWFAFQKDKLLIHPESPQAKIPCLVEFAELGLPVLRQHHIGRLDDRYCYVVEVDEGIIPPQLTTCPHCPAE